MRGDRNLVSIPEAAFLLGESDVKMRERLALDEAFREAIVFRQPLKFRTAISLPLLGRWVHGGAFDLVRPDWDARLAQYRTREMAS